MHTFNLLCYFSNQRVTSSDTSHGTPCIQFITVRNSVYNKLNNVNVEKPYLAKSPSFLASLTMQSSDSPMRRIAPHNAYDLLVSDILPVCGSTSAMEIWIEAWSFACMILLLAELQIDT